MDEDAARDKPRVSAAHHGFWVGDWAHPKYHEQGWVPDEAELMACREGNDGGVPEFGRSVRRAAGKS